MEKLLNFINGEYSEPQSGQYLDNFDPSTGGVYSKVADSDSLDMILAIQSANKAFEKWKSTPVEKRAEILYKIADLIDANADALAFAESQDQGKPVALAKKVDIPRAALNFRFFAGAILHHTEMATDKDGKLLNYTLRQPLGVAGLISPWNLPLYLLTWKIAPALACGNTAVCKPSEFTSKTASLLGAIFNEAGLPPGVCNIVLGRGETVGQTLVSHPGVPLISFTGGTATGEKILKSTASHFKKVSLELGGKNATIVLKDADLKKTIPGVIQASFMNQGEVCLCGEKILVQEEIYDEFLEKFVAATKELQVGDPQDPKTFMGPLVSEPHYLKVKSLIDLARKDKGKIIYGGDRPEGLPEKLKNGYFLNPTIITDISNCSELHQTEVFGPVVTVAPFKYNHDAAKWANNSPYGLSASIWTENLSKAHKLAAGLDVGTVWINTWLNRDLRVPFGGFKASGQGREGGSHSIDFYTELKTVSIAL
ncbi:MAG: aldehyde dehydrogenase [Bdellovibrionales bacterium]|nr:aldehyde dehydrogenase [Bdellovibrionales bacterium]